MLGETLEIRKRAELMERTAPLVPESSEIEALGGTERVGFWLTHRMNLGLWKRMMTFCQRHIGSLWIFIATYNLMNVFGVENFETSDSTRPLVRLREIVNRSGPSNAVRMMWSTAARTRHWRGGGRGQWR